MSIKNIQQEDKAGAGHANEHPNTSCKQQPFQDMHEEDEFFRELTNHATSQPFFPTMADTWFFMPIRKVHTNSTGMFY